MICQVDFENSSALINPANEELFPWLSQVATAFTAFEWKKLNFRYVANTDTGTSGTVAVVVNGDPDKPPLDSEKTVLNHEGSVMSAPWGDFTADGLPKSSATTSSAKYVADVTGVTPAGLGGFLDDVRQIASGVLNVATLGLAIAGAVSDGKQLTDPDPKPVGKLFVDYDVLLWDPVEDTLSGDNGISEFAGSSAASSYCGIEEEFFPGMGLNPLKILLISDNLNAGAQLGEAVYGFSEAGTYMIVANNPLSGLTYSGAIIGFSVTAAGGDADYKLLFGPTINISPLDANLGKITNSGGTADTYCGFIILEVINPDNVTLTLSCNNTGGGNIDVSNVKICFAKVNESVASTVSYFGQMLPKGQRGCLPDLRRSNAAVRFRAQHRKQQAERARGEMSASLRRAVAVSAARATDSVSRLDAKSQRPLPHAVPAPESKDPAPALASAAAAALAPLKFPRTDQYFAAPVPASARAASAAGSRKLG